MPQYEEQLVSRAKNHRHSARLVTQHGRSPRSERKATRSAAITLGRDQAPCRRGRRSKLWRRQSLSWCGVLAVEICCNRTCTWNGGKSLSEVEGRPP
eukprot:scaffold387_cov244-Pinguiococcus_pyrenoidosus.AAC.13